MFYFSITWSLSQCSLADAFSSSSLKLITFCLAYSLSQQAFNFPSCFSGQLPSLLTKISSELKDVLQAAFNTRKPMKSSEGFVGSKVCVCVCLSVHMCCVFLCVLFVPTPSRLYVRFS